MFGVKCRLIRKEALVIYPLVLQHMIIMAQTVLEAISSVIPLWHWMPVPVNASGIIKQCTMIIWDYDLSSAPQLLTVNRDGKKIDAVAIATKHGFVFVFDRVTGEPVFPIEEKPFPASEMPGEKASPTQPISSLPSFTRHEVTKETLNPFFPEA